MTTESEPEDDSYPDWLCGCGCGNRQHECRQLVTDDEPEDEDQE